MKKLLIAILALLLSSAADAFSQGPSRPLDNFDIAGGVMIHLPPPPPPPPQPQTRRVRRNGRWVTVPVQPPATRRTAMTSSVNDGLATREAGSSVRLIMGTGTDLKGFTTGNAAHDAMIVASSRKYRIDPLLIYAQMHQESSFKVRATSHKGASGLMQLMPATARRFGVTSIYDPKQNIDAGVRYMRWLLDYFEQDVVLALAGYNAGEGAVLRYGRRVPPFRETQEYVRRISARYNTISNPRYVQTAARQAASEREAIDQKDTRPLTVFEPAPLTVRLPDGRMILVNQ
ncbi:MAG TPA: lytic transglycosylase domain-containing protein [Pyrinomonadaceae bacterium]|nr:lytic transglycosylase domain-containing protein [Pyrinomonadaceae bacterium]HMP64761.1 lytic transglycosylase domain-containing protein [Pyrinomonadaceae bacterium]